jgi:hypothetical protein
MIHGLRILSDLEKAISDCTAVPQIAKKEITNLFCLPASILWIGIFVGVKE